MMNYSPLSRRLQQQRMPGQRMPAIMPESADHMPPGQGDMGEELMEQRPGMGPMAQALLVHTPAEAAKQRGYAMPLLDRPDLPSMRSPQHQMDINPLHTAQHQSIARALMQKRVIAQQKLMQKREQLSQIIKSGKAGQDLDRAQSQLSAVEGLLRSLGPDNAAGE